jgi:hypothetical protein
MKVATFMGHFFYRYLLKLAIESLQLRQKKEAKIGNQKPRLVATLTKTLQAFLYIYVKFSFPPFLGHVISLDHNVCNERLDQVEGNLHVAIIEVIL